MYEGIELAAKRRWSQMYVICCASNNKKNVVVFFLYIFSPLNLNTLKDNRYIKKSVSNSGMMEIAFFSHV